MRQSCNTGRKAVATIHTRSLYDDMRHWFDTRIAAPVKARFLGPAPSSSGPKRRQARLATEGSPDAKRD